MSAPKLYSSHQNKGSFFQGAHIRFKEDGKTVEIIHCIALFSKDLKGCFQDALDEVFNKFPDLKAFDDLIDNNFLDNFYSDDECKVLSKLILPTSGSETYNYEDRIAIFIGYDKEIESSLSYLQPSMFQSTLEEYIIKDIKDSIIDFESLLANVNIVDAIIDCFFVPFEDTEKFKNEFIESF